MKQPNNDTANWWKNAVIYQVYPRSFADSNADGIGDLAGVTSRLEYLADLGIDAIWLSPFYPSPLADGGYDISNYRDVDPRLGTLEDFDQLTRAAHALGIRIIVDIVPNHTSEEHPWFQQALNAGPGSPERDRYIFHDGKGANGEEPPADWQSHFGGSAWERTNDGQWYCHLFAKEQPDLNWGNQEVRQYFLDTLRFWSDRGVDGFRVDVAHSLAKDLSEPLRSQPYLDTRIPVDGTDPLYDRDEVHAIYETWRQVFNEYDPPRMAVAETWHPTSKRTYLYARPTELGQVFDFSLLKASWGAADFRAVIQRSLDDHHGVGGGLTWVLSNHDVPRHASRYALPDDIHPDQWLISNGTSPIVDQNLGLRRARAATLMMLALPGSAYLYQGEELGLPEVPDLPEHALQDPVWFRTGGKLKGRDGCRVPLPWTIAGPSCGFGAGTAWLPQPSEFGKYSVEAQQGVDGSTLEMYREALRRRREIPALASADFAWSDDLPTGIIGFNRGDGFRCLMNAGSESHPLPSGAKVLSASIPVTSEGIPADSTVWLSV
ncbi:glycoside hydrolase family 13 protein [Arthrobacter tumbae]|uniref:glycoside hydrolase family 13 protein n=1 Tax=Arthrobacter tumbae TaxID=163874 RepID=UPI00195C2AAB|nr:glycoside hydrolase family 13 protein [Arthrobacter tumbae]MBM7782353.1 alpha-glucosidase [Arthrobacter tumbae]